MLAGRPNPSTSMRILHLAAPQKFGCHLAWITYFRLALPILAAAKMYAHVLQLILHRAATDAGCSINPSSLAAREFEAGRGSGLGVVVKGYIMG
ncbi:hypothetical protein DSO57_1023677 [Entomophthora muscae]|uniref:Uncharacterized protein n=1 Tax=Entomophthora muscae TaxID=34485 RepID=A0ACC2SFL1_9FUNG|nr:hypothetical protein DSO57_1023677 [Entomophthora muscae]